MWRAFWSVGPANNGSHVSGQPQADGKTIRLWASDHEGWLTMDATAVLR